MVHPWEVYCSHEMANNSQCSPLPLLFHKCQVFSQHMCFSLENICILPIHICLRFRLRQLWQNIEKKNDDRIECRSVSATGNNNNNSNSVVFNKYHYKFLSSSAALNRVYSMNMRNVNNQTLGDGRRGTLCASHRLSVESFRNIFM